MIDSMQARFASVWFVHGSDSLSVMAMTTMTMLDAGFVGGEDRRFGIGRTCLVEWWTDCLNGKTNDR